MAMDDNSDIDLAIARVQMAIAESDLRAANGKLKAANKSRTNYSNRSNQTKAFKPTGVSAPSNFKYELMPSVRSTSFRAGERSTTSGSPKASTTPWKAPKAPSAAQISSAQARSGATNVYTPTTAPKSKAPNKPYVAPKPTAQQIEAGRLRGGNVGGSKPVKFSGPKPLTSAQKKAIADAKKKAGGRA
jgi:hypothetical protein